MYSCAFHSEKSKPLLLNRAVWKISRVAREKQDTLTRTGGTEDTSPVLYIHVGGEHRDLFGPLMTHEHIHLPETRPRI